MALLRILQYPDPRLHTVAVPVNGRVPTPAGAVRSARETLFTSGSIGAHSKLLNSVLEAPGGLYKGRR